MTSVWRSTLLFAWDFATQGYVLKVLCGEGIHCHYLRWKEEHKKKSLLRKRIIKKLAGVDGNMCQSNSQIKFPFSPYPTI